MIEHLDALVLGSGQAGNLMAWHMAGSGHRTALVERRWIGGACPNIACMPSKNEVWSARIAHLVHQAGNFGTITTPGETDMARVRQRKRDMVSREVAGFLQNFKTSGAELILGSGRFIAPKTLEVQLNDGGARTLTADKVFLNIGTHAAIPPIPGLEAAKPLTHIEILEIDYVPSHLIVLGGGYVGLEMAQAYRRFGSRVTVIESGPRIIGREDPDAAEEILKILSGEGIRFLIDTEITKVEGRSGKEIKIALRTPSARRCSKRATSSLPPAASRTRPGSVSKKQAWRWTRAATFTSANDWRRARPAFGRWGNAPAARNSRMCPSTIFGSSKTIWPAAAAAQRIGWFPIASLRTRRWRM